MNLKRFKSDESGSIAAASAISVSVLLLFAAATIDLSVMTNKKDKLQDAADIAALAAAVSTEESPEGLKAVALEAASANYFNDFDINLELENSSKSVKVELSSEHPMMFMGMFGNRNQTINVESGALRGFGSKFNLALALDTTLSMEGDRMSNMISAATALVDNVKEADKGLGNAKVAVMPFADYVRIDRAYADEPWIDVQEDQELTWQTLDEENSVNCREEQGSGESVETVCDSYVYNTHSTVASWNGCMVSRPDDFHKVAAYDGRPFMGNVGHTSCNWNNNVASFLSRDFDSVKADIEALTPRGKTYIPAGLIWAWRALEEESLFTDESIEEDEDGETQRVLLLMTDGSNTARLNGEARHDDWDGIYHWGSSDEEDNRVIADALTLELCASVKASGIRLITVAYEVEDVSTKNMLNTCASADSDYYNVTDVTQLAGAFRRIGAGFKDVRLTY